MDSDSKYIHQTVTKFNDIRRPSDILFDIYKKNFKNETRKRIEHKIRNCKSSEEADDKLYGIMTEVIALVFKQAEPLILSNMKNDDHARVKRAINEIRTDVSKRWRFVYFAVFRW